MLVCSTCLNKEIKYRDGSTKINWCEDCVPRGCSCNEEYFFSISEEAIKNDNIYNEKSYKEEIEEIIKNKNKYKIFVSETGVIEDKKVDIGYTLHLDKAKFKEIDIEYLEQNKNKLINNTQSVIKIVNIDENGKEYPCVEIMEDGIEDDIFIGAKFYSLAHGQEVSINYIYPNKNFRASILPNDGNDLFYNKYGMNEDALNFDLLIDTKYEVNDKEFELLRNFIFDTADNEFILSLIKKYKYDDFIFEKLEETNADFSILLELYNEENTEYKELIFKEFKVFFQQFLNNETEEKVYDILFQALKSYHNRKNEIIQEYVYDNSIKNEVYIDQKTSFKQVFMILYFHIKDNDN